MTQTLSATQLNRLRKHYPPKSRKNGRRKVKSTYGFYSIDDKALVARSAELTELLGYTVSPSVVLTHLMHSDPDIARLRKAIGKDDEIAKKEAELARIRHSVEQTLNTKVYRRNDKKRTQQPQGAN